MSASRRRFREKKTQQFFAGEIARRRAEGIAPKTLNDELGLLGHAYKLGMREWEWVSDNPVLKIAKEKVRNLIERWLTVEEEQRLLQLWLQEIIVFALHTGLRRGEILTLQWAQVDLVRRTLTILEPGRLRLRQWGGSSTERAQSLASVLCGDAEGQDCTLSLP